VVEESAVGTDAAAADAARGTVSRRSVLTASAAVASGALPLLLTACKGVQALGTPPPPAPDIVALRTAILAEETLLARYTAVVRLASNPAGSGVVTAIRTVQAEHVAHLAQLKSRLVEPAGSTPSSFPSASSSPSASPSASGSPGPTPGGSVTGTLPAALTALEEAEQAASDRLIGQLGVLPASLAQLFASVAASEAAHVPYLRAAARRGL
jgi:hypothetical protein